MCWHRQSLMWQAHQRAMRLTWQWTKHFPLFGSREPHRFQRISAMPITKCCKLGRGLEYKYAHDYPNHYVEQQYLPDAYKDMKFYEPTENGYEQTIREYFKKIKQE